MVHDDDTSFAGEKHQKKQIANFKKISRSNNAVYVTPVRQFVHHLAIKIYERYCGNVLTWKTFTADLYEHKHKKNRQDRDQYLYRDQHPAIVSVEKFEAVQTLSQTA